MPKIAEIEPTPNPNAVKFVLKEPLTSSGAGRSYDRPEAAAADPLARELFAIPHVTNVFYVDKWLTVTQDGQADWSELMRQLAVPIRAAEAASAVAGTALETRLGCAEDIERLARLNEVLDRQIRPALSFDGGGLEILELSGNVMTIRYQGACGSCPSSLYGTLAAIENVLRAVEPDLQVITV